MHADHHATPMLEPDRRLRLYRNRMGEPYLLGPNGLSAWVHGLDACPPDSTGTRTSTTTSGPAMTGDSAT